MATSIKLIQRYVWLVDVVRRAGKISLEEINRNWQKNVSLNDNHENEIPDRTFHRHREAIADLFGIEIVCDRATNTYYIKDTEALEKPTFTNWLFNGLSLNNILLNHEGAKDRIIFEDTPGGNEFMQIIIEAIDAKKVLSMTYRSYSNPNDTHWEIKPLWLKLYRRRWYIICRPLHWDKNKTFSLDRIQSIEMTEETFVHEDTTDIDDMFSEVIGVNLDEELDAEDITVRVYRDQRKYFESVPLHHSQKMITETDEYSDYHFHLRPEYEFQHEILRLGDDAEILSPEWLRNEMRGIAQLMHERYSN